MSWATYNKAFIKDNIIVSERGCWEWQRWIDTQGYGRVGAASGEHLAHRLSYRLFKGETNELNVLHNCDNPCCCNPEHLFLGTQADNVADAISKGRHYLSQDATKAAIENNKIPAEKRLGIIEMLQQGRKQLHIAEAIGVSERTVRRIKQQEGI